MITTDNIVRAVNALRPDWQLSSLRTFIARNCHDREPSELLIAFTACATATLPDGSPAATTPAHVLQPQWWPAPVDLDHRADMQCDICGRNETQCQKAQQNAIRIGNGVHNRHPGRQWTNLDRHDFTPFQGTPPKGRKVDVAAAVPGRHVPERRVPWLPEDLAEEVAARSIDFESREEADV